MSMDTVCTGCVDKESVQGDKEAVCWLPCSASVWVLATSLILNGRACLRSGEGALAACTTPVRERVPRTFIGPLPLHCMNNSDHFTTDDDT